MPKLRSLIPALVLAILTVPLHAYALVDDRNITITSASDIAAKRQAQIDYIWGPGGFPYDKLPTLPVLRNDISPVGDLPNLERVDTLTYKMDRGISSYAHHFIPVFKNNRLVVLNLGHIPTFSDSTSPSDDGYGMRRTIEGLIGDGYSVLAVYMPRKVDFTSSIRVFEVGKPEIHNKMLASTFYLPSTGSPMKYFLEPVAAYLNYLTSRSIQDSFPQYTDYNMVGFSGGGWTAAIYPAIDTRIRLSISVAGSIPLFLRSGKAIGDLEQTLEGFYSIAGYPDLYVMSSYSAGRRQIQVQNRRDWCCFGELHHDFTLSGGLTYDDTLRGYESQVRTSLRSLGDPDIFRLEIDEAAYGHSVTWDAIYDTILPELGDGRRYIGSEAGGAAAARGRDSLPAVFSDGRLSSANLTPMVGVPAIISRSSGFYEIFYRDSRNRLVYASRTAAGWSQPEVIAAPVISDPAAVPNGKNGYDVSALQSDYRMYHYRWDGANLSSEVVSEYVKGLGPPTVIASRGRLDVFYRSWNRQLYHAAKIDAGSWSIESVGGIVLDFPTAAMTADGTFHVFVRGLDNGLWEASKPSNGVWSGWNPVSAQLGVPAISGSPSAVVSNGELIVYTRSAAGRLLTFKYNGGWTYADNGGSLVGSPTATATGALVRDSQGRLARFDGQAWTTEVGELD